MLLPGRSALFDPRTDGQMPRREFCPNSALLRTNDVYSRNLTWTIFPIFFAIAGGTFCRIGSGNWSQEFWSFGPIGVLGRISTGKISAHHNCSFKMGTLDAISLQG